MDTKSLAVAKEIISMKSLSADGIATNRLEMIKPKEEVKLENEL